MLWRQRGDLKPRERAMPDGVGDCDVGERREAKGGER